VRRGVVQHDVAIQILGNFGVDLFEERQKLLALPITAGHVTEAGFRHIVPRDAVAGTRAEYGNHVLDNTIAVLGRITTIDDLIVEWAGRGSKE